MSRIRQERSGPRLFLLSTIAFLVLAGVVNAATTVTIDQPAANSDVSGSVNIGITTSVTNNVSIYYKLNTTTSWTLLGYATNTTDNTTWNYTWDTTAYSDGNYTLAANATNATDSGSDTNININVNNSVITLSSVGPSGTQSTTSLTLTVTTSEAALCYYNASGGTATTAFSTNAPGVTVHNESITGSWGVSETYNISCTSYWWAAEKASTPTTFFPASSGGIVTPMWKKLPSYAPENKQIVSVSNIPAGGTGSVTISKEAIAITGVTFSVVDAASLAKVTVEKKDTGPAGVSGTVYQYDDITITETPADNIAGGTISFKVTKSWYTDNSIDYTTTKLYRYSEGVWSELTTTMSDSDDTYYYFTATTPGFSTFAITAGAAPAAVCTEGETQDCTTTENCPGIQTCANNAWSSCVDVPNDNCPAAAPTGGEKEKKVAPAGFDYTWLVIVIIVIIIIAAAVFYTRGRQYPIRGK